MKPLRRILFPLLICLSIPAQPQQNDVARQIPRRMASRRRRGYLAGPPHPLRSSHRPHHLRSLRLDERPDRHQRRPQALREGTGQPAPRKRKPTPSTATSPTTARTRSISKPQTITHHFRGLLLPDQRRNRQRSLVRIPRPRPSHPHSHRRRQGGTIDRSTATYKLVWERIK